MDENSQKPPFKCLYSSIRANYANDMCSKQRLLIFHCSFQNPKLNNDFFFNPKLRITLSKFLILGLQIPLT